MTFPSFDSIEKKYQEIRSLSVEPQLHPKTNRPINKPHWLKVDLGGGESFFQIKQNLRQKRLYTVCEEARCPNIGECWASGTATFMILGDTCTRGCRFCHVKTGNPEGLLDPEEPAHTAYSIAQMELDYAVITMVDRDDLPDGGAAHIAATLAAIHNQAPRARVEILAGDFQGKMEHVQTVLYAGRGLDVFAHNIETVRRLSPRVRDARAKYDTSLKVLLEAGQQGPKGMFTKSAIMLGLGEEGREIYESLIDLRKAGVRIVTLGQYLQPTPKHLRVLRYVPPQEFTFWQEVATQQLGFTGVASGPLVRSSYKASHLFNAS